MPTTHVSTRARLASTPISPLQLLELPLVVRRRRRDDLGALAGRRAHPAPYAEGI